MAVGKQDVLIDRKKRRSDATFWRDGTVTDLAYWGEWQARMRLRAGWKRAVSWLAFYAGLGAAGWGLIFHWPATTRALAVACGLAAGYGLIRAAVWREDRRHNRDWVRPLNHALPPGVTVAKLARDRTRAALDLDRGLVIDDQVKQRIMLTAAAKLAIPAADLKPDWEHLHGKRPQVIIAHVPPPPGYVTFAAIQPYADAAKEDEFIAGLTRPDKEHPKGAPARIRIGPNPHLGFSIGSGGGKSVAVRNAACQFAHHGALVVCLDTKLISQHWCAGLGNVAYAREPAELHELAIWLYEEVKRRNQLALYHADVEGVVHANPGPRIIGILEELNATQHELQDYWKTELDGKGRSPACVALDKVAFTGRQVGVNLLYIAQRLSAKAVSGGSGDARENLDVLFMRNPAKRTWDMLVGDRHALPAATDVEGRLQIVTPQAVIEVQGAFVTGKQAREYATSGIVAVPRSDMPCVGGLAPVGTPERAAQSVPDMRSLEGHRPDLHVVPDISRQPPPAPPRITIPEAVAEGISGPTYEAVRKALARHRAEGRPVPVPVGVRGNADEYDRVEWCDWEEARRQPRRLTR